MRQGKSAIRHSARAHGWARRSPLLIFRARGASVSSRDVDAMGKRSPATLATRREAQS